MEAVCDDAVYKSTLTLHHFTTRGLVNSTRGLVNSTRGLVNSTRGLVNSTPRAGKYRYRQLTAQRSYVHFLRNSDFDTG